MSNKLERIISDHFPKEGKEMNHHHHPHEFIANHIILVGVIAVMFLMSLFAFLQSTPVIDQGPTAYAIVEFKPIDFDFGLSGLLEKTYDGLYNIEDRTSFLFVMYICWILIVGAVNLYHVEREHKKQGRK